MAAKFKITVDIPAVPSSESNLVIGRKLRVMQAGLATVDHDVAIDVKSVTLEANDGDKLHLELVNVIPATHGGSEQASRNIVVGSNIPAAGRGQLTVKAEPFVENITLAEKVATTTEESADDTATDELSGKVVKSPVANMHADEAIEHISNMRSHERLRDIVQADLRVTVRQAAQKKLDELTAE